MPCVLTFLISFSCSSQLSPLCEILNYVQCSFLYLPYFLSLSFVSLLCFLFGLCSIFSFSIFSGYLFSRRLPNLCLPFSVNFNDFLFSLRICQIFESLKNSVFCQIFHHCFLFLDYDKLHSLYSFVFQPTIWILYDDFCVTYFFYFSLVLSSYLSYFYLICARCYIIPLLF